MKEILSTQPYIGARDFYPEEMRIRNYIFDAWKRVCVRYGYEEYDFPILEPLEIFAAKTGEEIVKTQLFSFVDQGGRSLAIRPELTPGTVRMIAQKFNQLQKPIKWFMIGNNWRYERPQMGRGREFYQLEANIFGVNEISADFEIFNLVIDLMKEFGANSTMFELKYSDRKLINALLLDTLKLDDELAVQTRRLMDKRKKLTPEAFIEGCEKLGLTSDQADLINKFMFCEFNELSQIIPQEILSENAGYLNLVNLRKMIDDAKINEYCVFDPGIIRGFDYSDGLVYEVFDKNTKNRRSLFGGERFDKLIEIFGNLELVATGFAMGDWTLLEFLKNWNLLPELGSKTEYFVTVWPGEDTKYLEYSLKIGTLLRNAGKNTDTWLQTSSKLDKQLKYADKKGYKFAIIAGEDEISNKKVTIKNLKTAEQTTVEYNEFLKQLA
ncbi:histidine--tRNA ligase [candidate division WWE3 bacterium RIFOXYC1_FULL_39_7]|uniref:Histidine--tRNA ligase n=2 Tax=Katanobacteria TaxID=422282 RepID=A0A1F4X7R0_UNCKA|nr:MAG: histidine--tRNA ligase [candidate division WWE3 bacterium RIFOXYC1_FULL_39_7]OGC77706.1 MAG: histidine--tRNA ligase [candidate division WWE3 bacterium RIFOXYD1_FULL_39_9]